MLRLVMASALLSCVAACQPAPSASEQRTQTTTTPAPATTDNADTQQKTSGTIHLPSQTTTQTKGYAMPGTKPAEVCMDKGFSWLYQGYLRPECGTCHTKDNRYGVSAFAQGPDEASSFAVLKTVTDTKKLLEAVLGNVFCKSCVITKDDPLYADLQYFVQHMDRCEKTN